MICTTSFIGIKALESSCCSVVCHADNAVNVSGFKDTTAFFDAIAKLLIELG